MEAAAPIRALIVEDNEDDVLLLLNVIKKGGFAPEFRHVDCRSDLVDALKSPWDIVFSDYTMPSFNGHEALEVVRALDPDVPFFFVSGTIGEDRAVEAMRLGAQDYFIKGHLKRLPSAIQRELRDSSTRRDHRLAQERIQYLANYDLLTGLPNRTFFIDKLAQCLNNASGLHSIGKSQPLIAVFSFNLDRFKDVNDHLGAAAGDQLLIELGARLRAIIGRDNIVARMAADEFAIIATHLREEADVAKMAEALLSIVTRPFMLARYEWRVYASVGCSMFPRDAKDSSELLGHAAIALHHAQQQPGNSYREYSTQMRSMLQKKLETNRALEMALDQQQFQLHYQPQARTADGRILGVEALIRWHRPDIGMVPPDMFIPLAEESGLIVPIGEWVLREACRQIQQWRQQGTPLRVAVNFSAYQFRQPNLVECVARALHDTELPPELFEVEVTETALMQDTNIARSILSDLHNLGVSIALDDFGTGYSSLSYLKQFPVDLLKIDRAFISDLPTDQDDAAIVRAIIALAEKLGLKVIAEGVETKEQMIFLRNAGCDMFQGYYLQRPVPADQLFKFFNDSSRS